MQLVNNLNYSKTLEQLSQEKWDKGIIYTDEGTLLEVSIGRIFWEKIKGLFGAEDHSNKEQIKFFATKFIVQGFKENQFSNIQQMENVIHFAKRIDLLPKEGGNSNKIDALFSQISTHLSSTPDSQETPPLIDKEVKKLTKKDLASPPPIREKPILASVEKQIELKPIEKPVSKKAVVSKELTFEKKDESPVDQSPTKAQTWWNWSTAAKIGLIAVGVLAAAGAAYSAYSWLESPQANPSDPFYEEHKFSKILYNIFKKDYTTHCTPKTSSGEQLCLKDFSTNLIQNGFRIEYGKHFPIPVNIQTDDCNAVIKCSADPQDPRFEDNAEYIKIKVPEDIHFDDKQLQIIRQNQAGSPAPDASKWLTFKSHMYCNGRDLCTSIVAAFDDAAKQNGISLGEAFNKAFPQPESPSA